jgi:putative two-component system response regulator
MVLASMRERYRIVPFTSGAAAIRFFERGHDCDLILMDIDMPGMNGFETLRLLRTMPQAAEVPVIFLTGYIESEYEMEGLSMGAADYIQKPIFVPLLRQRIENLLKLQSYKKNLEIMVTLKTRTIERLSDVTIFTIVSVIGKRDDETGGHIARTSEYVGALATQLVKMGYHVDDLSPENIAMAKRSAPLHDIGKVAISDSILKKPGKLTPEEFEVIKTHTTIGADALREACEMMGDVSFLDTGEILARYHHEKWNGQGYPEGLKGEEIPIFARIMAFADVYDALISRRPYKVAMGHDTAVRTIQEGAGTHFDPFICRAFEEIHEQFDGIAHTFADQNVHTLRQMLGWASSGGMF